MGCGFPLLAPILIAVAYERVAQNQETDWDFAQDCLVTHGPPGVLNTVTGVCGLAAMLWLYGVAWHQPMAEAIALGARDDRRGARPPRNRCSPTDCTATSAQSPASVGGITQPAPAASPIAQPPWFLPRAAAPSARPSTRRSPRCSPSGTRAIEVLKVEGPRMLRAGNWRRAAELCRAWTDLELGNADAWRCLGQAQQAQGYHQDAINAFRKAKQHDPTDRSLDAAIDRSQKGIVADS